ncbi:MAG: hypothetical protein U0835_17565 [Isosphaeraceae bacterium]
MAQCQTNPDGRCTMEPPCPVGECYLYAVLVREHVSDTRTVAEDPGLARELADTSIAYRRGPYTEKEPWERTKLALVNAVLDTVMPGVRLVVERGDSPRVYLGRIAHTFERPRDLPASLREIADCLDGGPRP